MFWKKRRKDKTSDTSTMERGVYDYENDKLIDTSNSGHFTIFTGADTKLWIVMPVKVWRDVIEQTKKEGHEEGRKSFTCPVIEKMKTEV